MVAANPDPESRLPYLLWLPLGRDGLVLKARETWPRTSKVYCHPADGWPDAADVVERVPVRACTRRGAAIDLVLDRHRENRSQFVHTRIKGDREAIFWQSARTAKQARPNVRTPKRRASGLDELTILVDSHERYAYTFSDQRASTQRRALTAGDYGVELDGELVAAVERKSLDDLVSVLTGGKFDYLMADLASLHRAAVVVEDRYSQVFRLQRVRPGVVAEALAEAQVRWPGVPIVFCETRGLAGEWTFRFLGAALTEIAASADEVGTRLEKLTTAPRAAPSETSGGPSTAEVRAWARENGFDVSDRGRLRPEVWAAYRDAVGPPGDR